MSLMTDSTEEIDDIWEIFNTIKSENKNDNSPKTEENCCDNCLSYDSLVEDKKNGFVVCNICGAAFANVLDLNPEWNSYGADNGRCGMATSYFMPKSSLGSTLAGSKFNRMKRLHDWGAMNYREKSLYNVLEDINARCNKHGIMKNVVDDAKLMYKKISECKHIDGKNKDKFIIIRGANRRSLIAACVFYACKVNGCTRSTKEIAKVFDLEPKEMTRGCKKFALFMKEYHKTYNMKSSTPEHFIKRYCVKMGIHKECAESARMIAKNIKKLGLASDHTPPSVAAGAIQLMSKINNLAITKKDISIAFEISEVTIAKIYKKIEPYGKILISDEETANILKMLEQN
jgi:transcription initiation factor TFIIIB Brf1 subunit/transcription initiation factor TFIIB